MFLISILSICRSIKKSSTEAAWVLWKVFFVLFTRHFGWRKSLWQCWGWRFNIVSLLWFQMSCRDVWGEVFFKQLFDGLKLSRQLTVKCEIVTDIIFHFWLISTLDYKNKKKIFCSVSTYSCLFWSQTNCLICGDVKKSLYSIVTFLLT